MKTFVLSIIPRIQQFSKKLDTITVLTNKHWVVIDEEVEKKIVFIFREKENQLLISENGRIEKGSWEYLGDNSLLIDRKDGSYLFKHGFVDDTVLALKVDGKNEYALLVNENNFENQLNSHSKFLKFLKSKYGDENQKRVLNIPKLPEQQRANPVEIYVLDPLKEIFKSIDYPELISDIEQLKVVIKNIGKGYSSQIVIGFCKEHSIKSFWANANPELTNLVVNKKIPIGLIEQLFRLNEGNQKFLEGLEEYLMEEL